MDIQHPHHPAARAVPRPTARIARRVAPPAQAPSSTSSTTGIRANGRRTSCGGFGAPARLEVNVHFNTQKPTIGSGRTQQLNHCKTPLLAFIDDDLTVHGDLLGVLEEQLQSQPVGILGVQSLVEDSDRRFKPRRSTPRIDLNGLRFMPVQGMLVAGYRRLFLDIGGFNPRREFWGEWTEFNLRMWRSGFPTAYAMNGAYLRHWEKAPESPTRNMSGREDHVLWGLLCTALEYDAIDEREDTRAFWDLVESRYLAYAFGADSPSAI
ncbi:MAG: glycosyltransferase [Gemmatimonadetes bacterium]|nr:glycosyltransferase [Gemmatimonadota bacterium]